MSPALDQWSHVGIASDRQWIDAGRTLRSSAIGFAVIFATTRTFHFAHGGVYLWVAYVISDLMQNHITLWIALPVGLATSVLLSVLIELGAYRPLRRRGVGQMRIFVAAFGIQILLQNLILIVFGSNTRPINLTGFPQSFHLGSVIVGTVSAMQFGAAIVMISAVVSVLKWTQVGRSMRAVASNQETAAVIGIDPQRTFTWSFAIGGALLVPGAFLNSATTGLDPGIGMTIMLTTLIAVIVGGIGSIGGAAAGGWAIGLCQSMSQLVLPLVWQDTVTFGLLLVFILFRPTGLFGRKVWEATV